MSKKEIDTNVDLKSRRWERCDEDGAARPFTNAGFTNAQEVMDLRVFDMLNICGIDRIMAEEMMYALYRFFNEDKRIDDALYDGVIDQYFDFDEWKEQHQDASKVLVKDIVLPVGMNFDAVIDLFDWVVRKFWKSDEYNIWEYRYWGYKDILQQKKRGEGK